MHGESGFPSHVSHITNARKGLPLPEYYDRKDLCQNTIIEKNTIQCRFICFTCFKQEKSRFYASLNLEVDEAERDIENRDDDAEDESVPEGNYKELIFADLCCAATRVYFECAAKVMENAAKDTKLAALAYRINEEYEFLKVIII